MKFTKSLVAAGIALSALGAQAQNLVTNGSFEDITTSNTQTTGSYGTYTSIVGWTGAPNIEVRDAFAGVAYDGSNFVELDTTHASKNSSMFQEIEIKTAGEYLLSFYYSARIGIAAGSNNISYTFGSFADEVLKDVAGGTEHNWQHYTRKVYLTGDTVLTFAAGGKCDTLGGSLDNVSVTAVPEVETYAMMLAGLGLMGTIARRRKNKAA